MCDNSYENQVKDFNDLDGDIQELIIRAVEARKFSYCPYSNFSVGAALRTETGEIFSGCNIESKVYTPTVCAERTAVCKAVSEGHKKFISVAVAAYQDKCFTTPCGVCREILSEFAADTLDIYMTKPDMKRILCMKLYQLLPLSFKPSFT